MPMANITVATSLYPTMVYGPLLKNSAMARLIGMPLSLIYHTLGKTDI